VDHNAFLAQNGNDPTHLFIYCDGSQLICHSFTKTGFGVAAVSVQEAQPLTQLYTDLWGDWLTNSLEIIPPNVMVEWVQGACVENISVFILLTLSPFWTIIKDELDVFCVLSLSFWNNCYSLCNSLGEFSL
jgi:hypothetical protein